MEPSQYLLLFLLSAAGAVVGINFGGATMLVVPTLLGLGVPPLTVLASTRPAVVVQSLLGLRMFRAFGDLATPQKLTLVVGAALGGLAGVQVLARLPEAIATPMMLGLIVAVGTAMLWRAYRQRRAGQEGGPPPHRPLWVYGLCGALPSILGGLVGSGAGLVVVLLAFAWLGKGARPTSYLEKWVSLGHAATVLLWCTTRGAVDWPLAVMLLAGNLLGAYLGARLTLRLPVVWLYVALVLLCVVVLVRMVI